jgi:signal transduction histidine kinase
MSAAACAAGAPARPADRAPGARLARRALRLALVVAVLALLSRPATAIVALLGGLALAGACARQAEPRARRAPARAAPGAGAARAPRTAARPSLALEDEREIGSLLAALADRIRDPLRAAQGLVRQMGEDPGSPRNLDCARLALREIDRLERSVSRLLAEAREAARRRGAEPGA